VIVAIADTHATIWYIYNDPRLSTDALSLFQRALREDNRVGVSTVTLAEVVYLVERNRVPLDTYERLISRLGTDGSPLEEVPF
jgi:PIN domain nuclease of toxin-antitoxin system